MSFKDISGNTKAIGILKNSLKSGRVAHSLLFAGPEGVGKRLTSLAFAKALNCVNASATSFDDSCGHCPDCARIDSGTHPNIIFIQPLDKDGEATAAGIIRIESIREAQGALKYRVERGKKVIIVDGAEKMQVGAANAFLKTLEEPPADSIIILISSNASELLPTILSRCQRINFRPLEADSVADCLVKEKGVTPEEAATIARLAGGSVSRAIRFTAEGVYDKRKDVIERIASLGPGDTYGALKLAEDLSKRDDIEEVLEFMKTWYRDRAVYGAGNPELAVNADLTGYLENYIGSDISGIIEAVSMIERARRDIMPPRYANKQLTMEVLLLGLTGRAQI